MNDGRIQELTDIYRDGLLNDTLPFWINHAVDREQGGFYTCLGRYGDVVSSDKPIWAQGRFAWMLATLYDTIEPRDEWLTLARHGIDFLRQHGFDSDGRMYFSVTSDGRPLRKRRYIFSETFTIIALAAYAKAAGDSNAGDQAIDLFRNVQDWLQDPTVLQPKVHTRTRPMKGLAVPMILIATAQVLRQTADLPEYTECIDRYIDEIDRHFWKPEFNALLETVGPAGEFIDTFEGRMICPGHSIEAGWFILEEARYRGGDPRLLQLGLRIIDGSWAKGWDPEYGGILYFADAKDLPCSEYWHDQKFWWPHNEAIIATLLAHHLTGNERYEEMHRQVHDWAYGHFPDPEHGEWYGYLHRDGRLSTPLKGSMWKGPFHLPRMQWYCWQLLNEMQPPPSA